MALDTDALKKLAVSQYQLQLYHNKIKSLLGAESTSESSKELKTYELLGSSGNFIYSDKTEYLYEGSPTTLQYYTNEATYTTYGIFKVLDEDKYLVFTVVNEGTAESPSNKFIYSASYTSSTLPTDYADLFEVGSYAIVHKLESADIGDSFNSKKVSMFLDNNNRACVFAYVQGISPGLEDEVGDEFIDDNNTYLIAVNQYRTKAWVYVLDTQSTFKWYGYYRGESNAMVAALSAIVDCAVQKYDSDVTYPDGTVGAKISQISQSIAGGFEDITSAKVSANNSESYCKDVKDTIESLIEGTTTENAQVALNTANINAMPALANNSQYDFEISDVYGNVIVRFNDGHIKTKNFDSSNLKNTENTILCLGDSLTQGQGTSRCYPTILSTLVGSDYTIVNKGESGNKIQDIMARTNAFPAIVKSDFTIPASGSVSLGLLYSSYDNSRKINNLIQSTDVYNPVTIQGIEGTLTRSGTYESATYTFQRSSSGDSIDCKAGTPVFGYEGTLVNSKVLILWAGTNGLWADEEELAYMLKSIVDKMGIDEYIVVGLTNHNYSYDEYTKSQFDYTTLTKIMLKTFGIHYIDTLGYFLNDALSDAGLSATDADTTAIANEEVPPSLLGDTVHFNATGYNLVANLIYNKLIQLNYI